MSWTMAKGGVGVGGVLHVHPDEAAPLAGVLDDLLDVGPAQLFVEGEAEARELYGDAAARPCSSRVSTTFL
jgi:hypothetical protein